MNERSFAHAGRFRLLLAIVITSCPVASRVDAHSPAIAADVSGGSLRAWRVAPAGSEIRVQRFDAAGVPRWAGEGARIVGVAPAEDPTIVGDGSGGAFIAWLDRRRSAVDRGVRALRLDANGSWAEGWPADGIGVCVLPGWASSPALAGDGDGGVWTVWSDRRADQNHVRGDDVFALRITSRGTLARGMVTNGVRVSTAPRHQRDPQAAPDGAGGVLVAWTDHRGIESDVFAQHLDGAGKIAEGWPANGLRLSPVAGEQRDASIAADGAGGAYVAWVGSEASRRAIRIRRIGPDGGIPEGWAEDGYELAAEVAAGTRARLVSDADGGVTAEWTDPQGAIGRASIASGGSFRPAEDPAGSVPLAFRVDRPRPNPTPDGARLQLTLPQRGHVRAELLDIAGRLVRRIEDRVFEPGVHTLSWDGSDARGKRVPPALYFLRVRTPSGSAVHPVVALH